MSESAKPATKEVVEKAEKVNWTYFRNPKFSGLSVVTDNTDDVNKYATVRFIRRVEKFQGDDVPVGYLRLSDPKEIEAVKKAPGVQVITQKEFEGK